MLRPDHKVVSLPRRLLTSNYVAYRTYREARVRASIPRRLKPLLVYQMGKVGSTSVHRALAEALPDRPVIHVHQLDPKNLKATDDFYRQRFASNHHIDSVYLRGRVVASRMRSTARQYRHLDIVTLVRDPMAVEISAFFQTLADIHPEVARGLKSETGDSDQFREVGRVFLQGSGGSEPFSWFDSELARTTGIDVFATPFDPTKGYETYEDARARVLLLRMEDLTDVFATAASDFLGCEAGSIPHLNQGARAYYADAYDFVRQSLTLPPALLDSIYSSERTRHFYSAEEIANLRASWER